MPLLREAVPIGVIVIRRTEVRPFSDKQVALLQTFADQAVIAFENVRLFQELEARTRELTRSVEELKALGEVGQAVSSTLELETVLATIVAHAVQLSGTSGGVIYEYDEAAQEFRLRASYRMEEEVVQALQVTPVRPGQRATGQTATVRAPVQMPDILDERGVYRQAGSAHSFTTGLSIRSGGSTSPRRADHGGADGLAQRGGQLFGRSCESSSDVRYTMSPGDPERSALP
jgi:GAF domain-containing protein